ALKELGQYKNFARAVKAPVLANLTEFGQTPLFSLPQMRASGVRLALYPLSAFRAMNKAAWKLYQTLRARGTQRSLLEGMQTRAELYDFLRYTPDTGHVPGKKSGPNALRNRPGSSPRAWPTRDRKN